MIDELCKGCIKRTTVTQCVNCSINCTKSAINQLYEFIEVHKSNLTQYIFFINNLYRDKLKDVLYQNMATNLDIRFISLLNTDELCIIVDKKLVDWGNINIDYKYEESGEI